MLWDDAAVAAVLEASRRPEVPLVPEAGAGAAEEVVPEALRYGVRLANLAAFEAAANWGEKSDVLRYEILSQVRPLACDRSCACRRRSLPPPLGRFRVDRLPCLRGASRASLPAGGRRVCGHGLRVSAAPY